MLDVYSLICDKYKLLPDGQLPVVIPDSREAGLVALWRELGYTTGAEIGVERGRFSEHICQGMPGVHLHCIDPWQSYTRYADVIHQREMDKYYLMAVGRLKPYHANITRLSSLDAVGLFKPESLDFVYIDADHELSHVIADISVWSPIVRKGGIVAGHDYCPEHANHRIPLHVMQAVDAYTSAYRISPWYIWQKDDGPSWMWVKE